MRRPSRMRGAALPIVLLLVALNVTVIVAMMIYATTELQASRNAVHTESARVLAQSGVELAASLIAANSTNNAFVSYQRVTNTGGAWRLETKIANVTAPDSSTAWKTAPTNATVLHSGFAAAPSGVDLNFAVDGDVSAGFIAPRTNLSGWTNLSPDMFRMNWLHIYRGDTNNPQNLVGRIAFWVDDESSKLNINYSGSSEIYGSGFDNSLPLALALRGPRPGIAAHTNSHGYFNGRTWPLDMELGGVAGLSITNVKDAISWRGRPDGTNFRAFPSVLGLRIGTLSGSAGIAGIAVTNLVQQSSLGFTATAFSSEAERSYRSGRRRYDLLNLYSGAPQTTMAAFRDAITAEYPAFAGKYDLEAFAGGAYSMVQLPGASTNPASTQHPAATFGPQRIYVRGLPVVNEISLQAVAGEAGGTNTVELRTAVELITLGDSRRFQNGWNQNSQWGFAVEQSTNYVARVRLRNSADPSEEVTLGGWQPPNPVPLTNASVWFTKRDPQGNGEGEFGPRSADLAGSFGVLTATNRFSTGASLGPWTFPDVMDVELAYGGKVYQAFTVSVSPPPGGSFSPATGATNVVYALVAQPRSASGVRGDPRLALFEASATADLAAGFPANYVHPQATTNALNPNWDVNATTPDQPDLMQDTLSFGVDYGLPGYSGTLDYGFGWTLAGVGWLGEVPVVTPSSGSTQLGWSTPRFWGDGRETATHPPDWLLMDVAHLAMFPADASGTFVSRGRVNVNSAKSFFQTVAGSLKKADSIMDSVLIGAGTKDFRTEIWGASAFKNLDGRQPFRTNVLNRIQEMVMDRTAADRPYMTHFEFLAELAATNVANAATSDVWMAPQPPGSVTATNTTDRRIEGIVRSLHQKFTTRGNQFSIFSLAQALQVTPSGKTNVVGESYLQAVYERAPAYDEATGVITNSPSGAPPMRQLFLRELRY